MKVFLDDERSAPMGWVLVRTVDEAVKLLSTGKVTVISLDHDLGILPTDTNGDREVTGYDVILWIENAVHSSEFTPPEIRVHSANTGALHKMLLGVRSIKRLYRNRIGR